ncbi:GNAT family N-acetyltransferase [Scopulibacillus cellulosilyticus]|uniref:GNAT family N-acetyltransferase n=1 Tax=Scopulibacillus cellulosilyticus TaxID=2665665 RepID=A0ABW2PSU2_9BACL
MEIREIQLSDAAALLNLRRQLEKETRFMQYVPDENANSVEKQVENIHSILKSGCSMIFVAETEGSLIGFTAVLGNKLKRIRHRASVIIGILEKYQNQGIGKNLLKHVDEWARDHGIERLELTIMAHNRRALGLYNTMGYYVEGMRRNALVIDNEIIDEFYMGKILKR